jgi:hypothetical protein
VDLHGDYHTSNGDVTVTITNDLDQDNSVESIGYGDMQFEYEFDPTVEWIVMPTESPADYDAGVENPTALWENDCNASKKQCSNGDWLYGGLNECGSGHTIWREFDRRYIHPAATSVTLRGKVWTIDSWDNESFTVTLMDQEGRTLATETFTDQHGNRRGDWSGNCGFSHWNDGYFNIELEATVDQTVTVIRAEITNALDSNTNDESIGYGEMSFTYDFNPNFGDDEEPVWPATSPANYDEGEENPTGYWQNDCGATEKSCAGYQYYGGFGECAQGHRFWRTYEAQRIHPSANRLRFNGMIWTIDSWDGETFTVEMTDADGNVLDSREWQGNNFANLAD